MDRPKELLPSAFSAAAVIPCLDCADRVGQVVEATRKLLPDVIVVDDGSRDESGRIAERAGAIILRHPTNLGKGAAILTGLAEAQRRGYTHSVTLDSDGQHDPADIPRMLAAAMDHPTALIVGARRFDVANVPKASRFGRNFSNFWVWLETGSKLSDTQSGFRVYPLAETLRLSIKRSRFELEVEVIVRHRWAGLPVREVPVSVYYPPPEQRKSHYRGFSDSALISLLHCRLVPVSLLRLFVMPVRKLLLSR